MTSPQSSNGADDVGVYPGQPTYYSVVNHKTTQKTHAPLSHPLSLRKRRNTDAPLKRTSGRAPGARAPHYSLARSLVSSDREEGGGEQRRHNLTGSLVRLPTVR